MAYDAPLREVLKIMGPTALSRELGIVPSAITQWDRVPAKWLLKISGLTKIPAAKLRPDLAPDPEAVKQAPQVAARAERSAA